MIRSKLRRLRFEKEESDGIKLTYEKLTEETGLSSNTLAALLKTDPIKRLDGDTLSALCQYFGVGIGDVLEYIPDAAKSDEPKVTVDSKTADDEPEDAS